MNGEQKPSPQGENLLAYLAATAPALFQLIAVISVGLVNILKISDFVIFPQFINIANLFVILLSLAAISLYSFWDMKKFSLIEHDKETFFDQEKKLWKTLRIAAVLAFMVIMVFISIGLNRPTLISFVEIWATTQWFSYITGLTLTSFIIYVFVLSKIKEKQSKIMFENFIPRLIDSLRRYGHVKDPDVVIKSIDRPTNRAVVIIENKFYLVQTGYDGEMQTIRELKDKEITDWTVGTPQKGGE